MLKSKPHQVIWNQWLLKQIVPILLHCPLRNMIKKLSRILSIIFTMETSNFKLIEVVLV